MMLTTHKTLATALCGWSVLFIAEITAAETTTSLAPVTVMGTRRSEPYSPQPPYSSQSVRILPPTLLQQTGSDRLDDVSDYLASVQPARSQAGIGSDVVVRGFALGSRALVNGLRDQQGYFIRDPATVERSEILLGADAVSVGSGSPGGTLNVITKKPSYPPQQRISLQTGIPARQRLVVDSSARLGDSDWAYRSILVGQNADTEHSHVDDDRATLLAALQHQDADSTLLLEAEASRQQREYDFDRIFIHGKPLYNVSYVDPRTQAQRDSLRLATHYQQGLAQDWQLHLSGNRLQLQRDERLVGFYALDNADQPLPGYYRELTDDSTQTHLRAAIHKTWQTVHGGEHHTRLGLERMEHSSQISSSDCIGCFSLAIYNPRFDYPLPSAAQLKPNNYRNEQQERGTFLQHSLQHGKTKLSAGIRRANVNGQRINSDTGNRSGVVDTHATPVSVGITQQLNKEWALSANRHASFTPNSGYDRNGKLLPPRHGTQHEVALTYRSARQPQQTASLNLYTIKQDNFTVRDPADRNTRQVAGDTQAQGAELRVTTPLIPKLTLEANYSYQDAELRQAQRSTSVPNVPRHSGAVQLEYQPDSRTDLFLGAVRVGKRAGDSSNSFSVPAYTRVDAGASRQLNKTTSIHVGVRNLFDKDYVAASEAVDFVVQGRKRSVTLGLEVEF